MGWGTPKIVARRAPRGLRKLCGISIGPISIAASEPFGQQLICDAAPPAARMAHFKMMAKATIGFEPLDRREQERTDDADREDMTGTVRTAVIGGDANGIKYRSAMRPQIQIASGPPIATGVDVVQSG